MSYDGIVLRAVSYELNQLLRGARIDKIYQPGPGEVLLNLRQPGQTFRLLLSASASDAGVYLTTQNRGNPNEPPLFCMVLRKHLDGGRVHSVQQHDMERILEINCEVHDELGDKVLRRLLIEIMGKHSNIILLEPERLRILDAIRRVTPAVSRYRLVIPGQVYQTPPPQDKTLPWAVDQDEFYQKILASPMTQSLSKSLLATYSGLGPQSADEIVLQAGLEPKFTLEFCGEYELSRLWQSFRDTAQNIRDYRFQPEVVVKNDTPLAFSALPLTGYDHKYRRVFPGINEALDYYFSHQKSTSLFQQKRAELAQIVRKEMDRCEKKAGLQEQTVQDGRDSEKYRLWGELLTANLYRLTPAKEVEVENFYAKDGQTERIPMDEEMSVLNNAQRYFARYQKQKNAAGQAELQLRETRTELEYLASLAGALDNVTILRELEEIREELQESGYLKAVVNKSGRKMGRAENKKLGQKAEASTPSSINADGWTIIYGKNNKQNDRVTMKLARSDDIWLHTKDIPGAHVIIKNPDNRPLPDAILEQAAFIAAYYSKARGSTHIPVDYTKKKYVWKPKGAKPGMVLYENQRTVYVTPSQELIDK